MKYEYLIIKGRKTFNSSYCHCLTEMRDVPQGKTNDIKNSLINSFFS